MRRRVHVSVLSVNVRESLRESARSLQSPILRTYPLIIGRASGILAPYFVSSLYSV